MIECVLKRFMLTAHIRDQFKFKSVRRNGEWCWIKCHLTQNIWEKNQFAFFSFHSFRSLGPCQRNNEKRQPKMSAWSTELLHHFVSALNINGNLFWHRMKFEMEVDSRCYVIHMNVAHTNTLSPCVRMAFFYIKMYE